jgi:uncharacterized BrkB/YihY/UPF0761 family membrane protein
VAIGLFEGGKYLIALYNGQTNVASSFGAEGALIVLLPWIFYSAQIFLLGAEFTLETDADGSPFVACIEVALETHAYFHFDMARGRLFGANTVEHFRF